MIRVGLRGGVGSLGTRFIPLTTRRTAYFLIHAEIQGAVRIQTINLFGVFPVISQSSYVRFQLAWQSQSRACADR